MILAVLGLTLLGWGRADGTVQSTGVNSTLPALSVKLRTQTPGMVFDVALSNPGRAAIKFSYGECDFSYQIVSDKRAFTFPTTRPFEFASPCPGVIHVRQIPPHGSLKLFTVEVPLQIANALSAAKGRYVGEFHFRYSLVGSGKMSITVFKHR